MSFLFFMFFCILAIVLVATAIGLNFMESRRKKDVKGLLHTVEGAGTEVQTRILVEQDGQTSAIEQLASRFSGAEILQLTLRQSGLDWSFTNLLAATLAGIAAGVLVGWKLNLLVYTPVSIA